MAKIDLDKFYTKAEIAEECISLIKDISGYDAIVEPSAGSGAFSNLIPACLAYDIEPENDSIIKQDFLELSHVEGKRILFIGNPPFGIRSGLAKQFIKKSMALNAQTIAFILPNTFSKVSNQGFKLFPKEWRLVIEKPLDNNSFLIEGQEYHVPCSFYVWTKDDPQNILSAYRDTDLRKTKVAQPEEFVFLNRSNEKADFSINGNNGKVKDLSHITNPKSEHYIWIVDRDPEHIESMKNLFSNITYNFKSSVNGGNAWVGQQEIIESFIEANGENN